MHTPFSRTLRAVDADGPRGRAGAVAGLFLAAWAAWFGLARVTVWEGTDTARLEVDAAAWPLDAPVGGRVVRVAAALDQEVRAGDALLEIDAAEPRALLAETDARLGGLGERIAALEQGLAAELDARDRAAAAADGERAEAAARVEEAEAAAALAAAQLARMEKLHADGALTDEARDVAVHGAAEKRAAAVAAATALVRVDLERDRDASERAVRVEALRQQLADARGETAAAVAARERFAWDADRYVVRAPVDGRLGELAELHVGDLVSAGARVGAVVPPGELRVVAHFAPSDALGRVAPGQEARVRLDGFPWTQWGSLPATVVSVASEPRYGAIRVELAVAPDAASPIPLRHGLVGTVEVATERVSPVSLALRAAGALVRRAGTPS